MSEDMLSHARELARLATKALDAHMRGDVTLLEHQLDFFTDTQGAARLFLWEEKAPEAEEWWSLHKAQSLDALNKEAK